MFSRKQYKQIGDILHERYAKGRQQREAEITGRLGLREFDSYSYWTGVTDALQSVTLALSTMFAEDNPERFSPRQFQDYVISLSKGDLGL